MAISLMESLRDNWRPFSGVEAPLLVAKASAWGGASADSAGMVMLAKCSQAILCVGLIASQ